MTSILEIVGYCVMLYGFAALGLQIGKALYGAIMKPWM